MIKKYLLFFSIALIGFSSCKKKEEDPVDEAGFDRRKLLENIGTNIIIPAYSDMKVKSGSLYEKAKSFTENPDQQKLEELRQSWKEAALSMAGCETFEFGPAENRFFRVMLNSFPVDTTKIESIINGTETLNDDQIKNLIASAKGFPATDYLIFEKDALSRFTSPNSDRRKIFLLNTCKNIRDLSSEVESSWQASGGNYINTFVSNTGTDVGSSLGYLVNQINYQLELIINMKIGLPYGKRSQGELYPDKAEAYFSGISLQLIIGNLETLKKIYQGLSGTGLDNYLEFLKSEYNGQQLHSAINTQIDATLNDVKQIPDPLSSAVVNDAAKVEKAYQSLKKQLVLFKVDMASALGILITYVDNDGD